MSSAIDRRRCIVSEKPSADRNGTHENAPSSSATLRHTMPGETRRVLLSEIDLDNMKFQFRIGMRAADLRVSMRDQGQQRPVDLRGSSPPYQLIDGFRRCAAARSLGWPSVLATIHDDLDDLHAFKLAFTRNVVRKNLTSVERANAIRVGMEGGMTKLDVVAELAMSEKQIDRYRDLLRMPAEVLAAIDGKLFTMKHALLMKKFDVGNVGEVIAEVKAKKLTVEQFRRRLHHLVGDSRKKGARRRFASHDGKAIRLYAGTISFSAPREERERAADQLIQAAMLLQREWRPSEKKEAHRGRAEERDDEGVRS